MSRPESRRTLVLATVLLAAQLVVAWAQLPRELGPPPKLDRLPVAIPKGSQPVRADVPAINVQDRGQVVSLFNTVYLASEGVDAQWNGTITPCVPGTTSAAYRDATLLRVNYFRVMAALPGNVVLDSTWNSQCQQAALMMIAEGNLSHTPPSTWACYTTDGATAAGKSNIAIGAAGSEAIDLYVDDPGGSNSAVGHRRWILYPPQQRMGTGSTTGQNGWFYGSNALWVIGGFGARPGAPEWVAWPPPGYVPYQVVYRRWSFSRPNANFANATIAMTHKGNPVSVTKLAVATGYGDNTVVWEPSGLPTGIPAEDLKYTVTISNVDVSGTPRQYVYDVTVIDPARVVKTGIESGRWERYR